MTTAKNQWLTSFFGKDLYIYLSFLFCIPIYFVFETYVQAIRFHEVEAVAGTLTFFFIIGVFTGRYLSQLWISPTQFLPNKYLIGITVLIIGCLIWLFALPFHGSTAIRQTFFIPLSVSSLLLGVLIKIVRINAQQQLREAQQVAAQSRSELQLLQSQLSPHFLFNTLNNLYGLSITQHEKIPPLLLKLSDLLRYSVYEAKEIFVPLQDELAYINNYIEFEKIRLDERLVLTTSLEKISNPAIKIAPMLLIVFIENAFKHSKNTPDQEIFIDITLKTWSNFVLFSIKNSCGTAPEKSDFLTKNSGFGLDNVKKRLELLYHNEYDLKIEENNGFYQVMLQLKVK